MKRLFCCFTNEKPENNNTLIYNMNNTTDKPIVWKDTIQFVPPIEKGTVIKVYDGDTITIASKLPYAESPLYRFQVRLNGIDCPEIKSKNNSEKECSLISKQELSNLILNKVITLKNVQTEKYGRILADVYLDELHLNKHMIDKRLAVAYDGGTKITPSNWLEYHKNGTV
jgi:endonuclease YncB( thermonuclease family)